MALNNPSNLYSGYAQVFNEAPHAAFRARLLQQHQAKMQALDDYYRKMPLLINEKGVRDQERPAIAQSMLGIKDYYIRNKDRLRNNDPEVQFNYEKMLRDHQDLVSRSQAAGLVDTQVGKLRYNPSVHYMFQSPETIEQLAKHHLPVTDPNHEDFDLETSIIPPQPLDLNKYMKPFDSMKYDDAPPEVIKNSDGTETVTTRHIPSAEAKSTIMSRANFDYLHNPSFTKSVDDLGTPDASNPLNSVFKDLYGRDIENPMDLGAALIAANKIQQPTTVKRRVDRYAMMDKQFQNALAKMKKNDEYIRGRDATRAENSGAIDVYTNAKSLVDTYFENQKDYKPIITKDGKTQIYGAVPLQYLDGTLTGAGVVKLVDDSHPRKGGWKASDIALKKGDDGSVTAVDLSNDTYLGRITERDLNLTANQLLGVKAKTVAAQRAGLTTPKIHKSSKPLKHKDPLGLF